MKLDPRFSKGTRAEASAQSADVLECGGIRFSRDLVVEIKQVRLTPKIRRGEVVGISLRWGLLAPLGGIEAVLGVFAMLCSLFLVVGTVRNLLQHTGTADGWVLVGHFAYGVVGASMFHKARQLGYYLEVRKNKRIEKLCFDDKISRTEVDAFLSSARTQLGWNIDNAGLEDLGRT